MTQPETARATAADPATAGLEVVGGAGFGDGTADRNRSGAVGVGDARL